MLFIALFTLLVTLVSARKEKCQKELAGIVYSVESPKKEYLIKISAQLRNLADFWNTPLGPNIVETFSSKYQVGVTVIDAFGLSTVFFLGNQLPDIPLISRNNRYTTNEAQAVLNVGSFTNDYLSYGYSFLTFGRDGSVYTVFVNLAKIIPDLSLP